MIPRNEAEAKAAGAIQLHLQMPREFEESADLEEPEHAVRRQSCL